MEAESSNRPQGAVGRAYLIAPRSRMGLLGLDLRGGELCAKSPLDDCDGDCACDCNCGSSLLLPDLVAREPSPPTELVPWSREE